MTAAPVRLSRADRDLLLDLVGLPTAGPMETGPDAEPPRLREAQTLYARAAAELGFEVAYHAAPGPEWLDRPDVPAQVREMARRVDGFLDSQPSLVLRLGPALPRARTLMFNVHLDTVAGGKPPHLAGDRFHGRGAVDAKGPAVALLAGLRAAIARVPALGTEVGLLVQAVAGEEGGAMGVFGTRPLVEQGWTGRINVFCEPTRGLLVPRATAAATARIAVAGADSIDDHPEAGHNASVLLGFLAQHLARRLPGAVAEGRVCIAGLHTGAAHNKVYGTGALLLNLAYRTAAAGRAQEEALERELTAGIDQFAAVFGGLPDFARTARDARRITRLAWLKRGLPALDSRDPWAERVLTGAGLEYAPPDAPACTCDAIWAHALPHAHTVVYGPGDLDANGAHAADEYVDVPDLEHYADGVASLVAAFASATNGSS
ncbi:M20/M25/M40 family metallo-hydrolase [Streptomyces sp. B8F3]|uniref:M20/M25/M40 family metallo-hydrolase n=1 Tax=unclassified Streptomyces TaxID=2593676 RepID=UPI00325CD688